jgi:hypothetical protein
MAPSSGLFISLYRRHWKHVDHRMFVHAVAEEPRTRAPARNGEKARNQNMNSLSGRPSRRNSTILPMNFVGDMSSGYYKSINASDNVGKS